MDIILDKVSKSLGDKKIFDGISISFPEGRISAVIAPSGKGKTTLMRLILGLEVPDSGTVRGIDVKKAALFQEDRLFENLSGAQNVRAASRRRITDKELEELFTMLGIDGEENTAVKKLSGGMARRVALARALLGEGGLLLLDEPFKGLDGENRIRVCEAVRSRARGRTVIFFVHSMEEAELMSPEKIVSL